MTDYTKQDTDEGAPCGAANDPFCRCELGGAWMLVENTMLCSTAQGGCGLPVNVNDGFIASDEDLSDGVRDSDIEPYELMLDVGNYGPAVVLTGPAWCSRASYEAFTDAGGAVQTRGHRLELRGDAAPRVEMDLRAQFRAKKAARDAASKAGE